MKKSILLLMSICLVSIAFGMERTGSGKARERRATITPTRRRSVADTIRLQQEAQEARLMEQAESDSTLYNANYNLDLCESKLAELSRKYRDELTMLSGRLDQEVSQGKIKHLENVQLRRTLVLVLQQLSTIFSVLNKSPDEQVKTAANLNAALRQLLDLLMSDKPLGTFLAAWHTKLKKMSKFALDLIEMANTIKKQQKKLQKKVREFYGKEESSKEPVGSLEFENQKLKEENEQLRSELQIYSTINNQIEKMMLLFQETTSKL